MYFYFMKLSGSFNLFVLFMVLFASCKKAQTFTDDDAPVINLMVPTDSSVYAVGDTLHIVGTITDFGLHTASINLYHMGDSAGIIQTAWPVSNLTKYDFSAYHVIQKADSGWLRMIIDAQDNNENINRLTRVLQVK